jgi:hypothetical protein
MQNTLNSTLFAFYQMNNLTQGNINAILNSFTSVLSTLDNAAADLQNNFPSGCGSWGSWYWQNPMACFSQAFKDTANNVATITSTIGIFKSNTSTLAYQLNQLSNFIGNI